MTHERNITLDVSVHEALLLAECLFYVGQELPPEVAANLFGPSPFPGAGNQGPLMEACGLMYERIADVAGDAIEREFGPDAIERS